MKLIRDLHTQRKEHLTHSRDDARVDGAAEDDGAGIEDQVEDEGAVVDGGAMGLGVEGVFVFGEDVARLRECFGTGTSGMRTGLIVESRGAAAALTVSRTSLRSSSVLSVVEPPERPRIFIFLK
jgi:hypothetical protein